MATPALSDTDEPAERRSPWSRWLRANFGPFRGAVLRAARRHPIRLLHATGAAAAQSVRARKGWKPRKIYVKELLLAIDLADQLADAPDVVRLHGHFAHGTTTITWLASTLTGLPFSFTGHAKDIYQASLNPAGLLERKMRAAEFVVTCTDANRRPPREAIAPGVPVHVVYHGLNADFAPLAGGGGRAPPSRSVPGGQRRPPRREEGLRRPRRGRRTARRAWSRARSRHRRGGGRPR